MITTESIEKDVIIKVDKELLNAMKDCEVKKLNDLLHEKLFFNISNGETITKSMNLEII